MIQNGTKVEETSTGWLGTVVGSEKWPDGDLIYKVRDVRGFVWEGFLKDLRIIEEPKNARP